MRFARLLYIRGGGITVDDLPDLATRLTLRRERTPPRLALEPKVYGSILSVNRIVADAGSLKGGSFYFIT